MDRFLHLVFSFFSCKSLRSVLSVIWVIGLLLGAVFGLDRGSDIAPILCSAAYSSPVFISLLTALMLPLFITACTVYFSCIWIVLPLVFGKAFLFSFVWAAFLPAFAGSAWMIRIFLMFADFLSLLLLWLFWLGLLQKESGKLMQRAALAAVGMTIAAVFDHFLLAPFLERFI